MRPGSFVTDAGISVTGTGVAAATADRVTITLAIEALRTDAGEAFGAAADAVGEALRVLSDHGVDSRSVRTADLSLGPRYDIRGSRQVLTGYHAEQRLVVSLDGLATVGTMLSDLVSRIGEGIRIEQMSMTAADRRAAELAAREAAMADAHRRATALAALAGRPLGVVVRVAEGADHMPSRVALMAHATGDAAAMPIAAGDTAVTVTLSVHYAWAD